jgi:flagellar basal-body rod protein FlgG
MVNFTISLSGIRVALAREAVSAGNIANILTPGFKARRLFQTEIKEGGVRISNLSVNLAQGPIELDAGKFPLAINGEGFFIVRTPKGLRYSRTGLFGIDASGRIVNTDGFPIEPLLVVPEDVKGLAATASGVVFGVLEEGRLTELGQIRLARFRNPEGLSLQEGGLFAETTASGSPIVGEPAKGGFGSIVFGALEGSNVELSSEIVAQILSHAVARMNISVLSSQNRLLGDLIDIFG